jgi:hypothetical protein
MTDVLPALAQLSERLGRCPDLDTLVSAALGGLADLFGYEHSLLLLRDEDGSRLYTIEPRLRHRRHRIRDPVGEGII